MTTRPATHACVAPTPSGPCTRRTATARCWQHRRRPAGTAGGAPGDGGAAAVAAAADPLAPAPPQLRWVALPEDAAAFLTSTDGWARRPALADVDVPEFWYHAGSADIDPDRDDPIHLGTLEQATERAGSLRRLGRGEPVIHRFRLVGPVHDEVVMDAWANFAAHGTAMEGLDEVREQIADIEGHDPDGDAPGFDEDDPLRDYDVSGHAARAAAALRSGALLYVNQVEASGLSVVVASARWLDPA